MSDFNAQVGEQVVARFPPEFDGYEVVDGTWKPKDLLMSKDHKGAKGTIFNTCFWGPGTEVSVTLLQYVTDPPTADMQRGDVIDEKATDANPNPGSWLVLDADPTEYGPQGIEFGCKLRKTDDQDLTQITPSS